MFEDLKKTMDKGMEYVFMTKDKVEKAVKEFARENNLNKEEAKKLLDQMMKKSEETWKTVEEKMSEVQKTALQKMNLVTREEYHRLEERIKKLESSGRAAPRTKPSSVAAKRVVPSRKKV